MDVYMSIISACLILLTFAVFRILAGVNSELKARKNAWESINTCIDKAVALVTEKGPALFEEFSNAAKDYYENKKKEDESDEKEG